MDYTTLLVKQYDFVRAAHKLSRTLEKITCDKGKILGPPEFANDLREFSDKLDSLAEIYGNSESEDVTDGT